jgi:hypothetical protein
VRVPPRQQVLGVVQPQSVAEGAMVEVYVQGDRLGIPAGVFRMNVVPMESNRRLLNDVQWIRRRKNAGRDRRPSHWNPVEQDQSRQACGEETVFPGSFTPPSMDDGKRFFRYIV